MTTLRCQYNSDKNSVNVYTNGLDPNDLIKLIACETELESKVYISILGFNVKIRSLDLSVVLKEEELFNVQQNKYEKININNDWGQNTLDKQIVSKIKEIAQKEISHEQSR